MIHKHWYFWMIVGGLGIDLIDAFTTKTGANPPGGLFYGGSGFLSSLNLNLPGQLTPGEVIAMVGAAGLATHKCN